MNKRDDFFYQAVLYAKEKDYQAARAMLRNLLFQYPDDIEGLLLYSIVAPNRDISIQALKRVLLIDPDHEIAFNKLAKLKQAPPASIPTPTSPLPAHPRLAPASNFPPPLISSPSVERTPQQAVREVTLRKNIETKTNLVQEKPRKKIGVFDLILIGLFIIVCLCVSLVGMQVIYTFFISGS